jgi:Fe-Mn family superoxide dismutase
MSAETLQYHHGKHHDGYVRKLNDAIKGSEFADLSLEDVIQGTARRAEHVGLFNNAAQVWNHSFFWQCMRPDGGGRPNGQLARQIDADFGSFEAFHQAFRDAATGQFGSGWAWLVLEAGKLRVASTANAEPPMVRGQKALLTCDVWEHAYYLDYQNERPRFVKTFLDNLVNWDFAAEQFDMHGGAVPTLKTERVRC